MFSFLQDGKSTSPRPPREHETTKQNTKDIVQEVDELKTLAKGLIGSILIFWTVVPWQVHN